MTATAAPSRLSAAEDLAASEADPAASEADPAAPEAAPAGGRLSLLNGFRLVSGGDLVPLPLSAQRLLALLALRDRPLMRLHAAAVLWPDAPEENARADLRTALWRVHRPGTALVLAEAGQLWLRPEVTVDLHRLLILARSLIRGGIEAPGEDVDLTLLQGELLPDWYDEWVIMERERVRQLRLHALEIVCERLTRAGSFGRAIEAGLAAVATEPLRESAHYVLIKAYLAEGNRYEAVRQYRLHRDQLREELGVAPSSKIETLVTGLSIR